MRQDENIAIHRSPCLDCSPDAFSITSSHDDRRDGWTNENQGRKRFIRQSRLATFLSFISLLIIHAEVNGWTPAAAPLQKSVVALASRNRSSRMIPRFVSTQSTTSGNSPSTADKDGNSSNHRRIKKKLKQKPKMGSIKSMFREAKKLERRGLWNEASSLYTTILEQVPDDAHSHLALARLEARREAKWKRQRDQTSNAELAFERGTRACADSVHLWQAWAVYEESRGNATRAQELFERALSLDPQNPYVCHAFGLYHKKLGETPRAVELFNVALESHSTAALVCSLGQILISQEKLEEARSLYMAHLGKMKTEKDRIEVYLASAWLEERYLQDFEKAKKLLHVALELSPKSSLVNVALARLEGRIEQNTPRGTNTAAAKRLADACRDIEESGIQPANPRDGRVFNALAQVEVKNKKIRNAREVLERGMQLYPLDHNLFQAAGKVEERLGNYTAARRLYGESLRLEPSAPTLVAYAMLEFRHPQSDNVDFELVRGLFEEALLLDPRHGPAYNAYGKMEFESGNIDEARAVFERGVKAECSDAGSLYHGYGKLELLLGNVDLARSILEKGMEQVRAKGVGSDSTHHERAKFLSHTLGMLELNSNRPGVALEIFQDGLHRCGNSSRLLLGAALSELKLGKDNSARKLFERAVVADKRHAQAWQAWGVMEMKAGNFKTAAALFQCGIRNIPSHGALWHGYASLELKKDKIHNARVLYAAGLQKAPNHVSLYQGWALLELREGNYQDAKKLISEALTRNKNNGSGWLIAAQIEQEQGNHGMVSLLLRRGIECAPNDPELYRKLGDYLVGRNHYNDAREVYEKGMELNPLHAPLYHSLAELEARVFNLDGLAKLNKRAAELFHNNPMEPRPFSSQAYGTRIRAKRSRQLPDGIAALAEKIVEEEEDKLLLENIDKVDPSMTLGCLTGSLLEDEFVGGMISLSELS